MKIFLVGFMGSGKTYWGGTWAKKYQLDLYDLDQLIEEQQQRTIATIFQENGEDYFRHIETTVLHEFSAKENCIIACGGGTPCFNDNMKWMNAHGTTVYLCADPQYIYDRVYAEKDKRPLISELKESELLAFIEQKLIEREPFYQQAKIILPVTELHETSLSTLNLQP